MILFISEYNYYVLLCNNTNIYWPFIRINRSKECNLCLVMSIIQYDDRNNIYYFSQYCANTYNKKVVYYKLFQNHENQYACYKNIQIINCFMRLKNIDFQVNTATWVVPYIFEFNSKNLINTYTWRSLLY